MPRDVKFQAPLTVTEYFSFPPKTRLNPNFSHLSPQEQIVIEYPQLKNPEMAMSCTRSLRSIIFSKGPFGMVGTRTFAAAGGKSKKGSKGGGAGDAPKASGLSNEVKSAKLIGGNILKDGTDPIVMADSECPDWLWQLLDKQPALSELKRKSMENLPYEELKRFVKLDNRARIKENNSLKAKN